MRDCPVALFGYGEDTFDVKSRPFNSIGEMTITAIVLESICFLRLIQYHTQQ